MSFDALVAEAEAAPIRGWDFSWLDGRATEDRPPWGYARMLGERARRARAMVDLQSGGGELLAGLEAPPPLLVATEGWLPNVTVAAGRLGADRVVATDLEGRRVPLRSGVFDLVSSRHPVRTWWDEVARLLAPTGTYLSQQVGPFSMWELTEALLGPQPGGSARDPKAAVAAARAAGLEVVDLREARLRATFADIGAVVWFLRLVVWIVPGFSVVRFRTELRALHERIERDGPFVAHSARFLIEARRPAR